jgi:hypothetical protein
MTHETTMKRTRISSSDYNRLRKLFDGDDKFMQSPNVVAERMGRVKIPDGMTLDELRHFLIKKYPDAGVFNSDCVCFWCQERIDRQNNKCSCKECKQTRLLLRWYTVASECFFHNKTASRVQAEQGWKPGTVGYIVQQIKRAWAGVRQDGKQRTGRSRGRPKKAPITGEQTQIAA